MQNEHGFEYTKDWFSWAPTVWTQLLPLLPARHAFLEVGSFEGASAMWTIEHLMEDGGCITCIDTWSGGEDHTEADMDGAEGRFDRNAEKIRGLFPDRNIVKRKGTSEEELAELLKYPRKQFDFIYIDGSHTAPDVLLDMCMAFRLLKVGGVMVIDDYAWGQPRDILHRPKLAIDAFTNIHAEQLRVVHTHYQLALQKIQLVDRS